MFPTFTGYTLTEKIYESNRSLVYRGLAERDAQPVVLKVQQPGHATPESTGRFRREFEITRKLDGSGMIHALELVQNDALLGMVLEDFGGHSLPHWLQAQRLPLATFLPLAIQISRALAAIHQQNLIHKDINPANIVWNPEAGIVKIIDFGLATSLPRENPEIRSPNVLEGTLAYISPEQTGRMNRAMDYRSDFYSLGVTFYHLAVGQLPFTAVDPLELIHAHIARQPPPPHQLNPTLPPLISDIILRLLAKNAEDRYQSAFGLIADLEECLRRWQTTGAIEPFALAQQDASSRFQLPQKLYGRDAETQAILQAFSRIAAPAPGQVEVMLVAGQAGIGKSALVQELYKPVTARRGYFAAGKFDQLQNAPYASLIAAFDGLLGQILTESEQEITGWRRRLAAALGANGQIIVEVLPRLEMIIGPQTAVPDLPPTEAEIRLNLTFQNFMRALAQAAHPLVLFLDDWQWMDGATRQLLQNLLTGVHNAVRHLLLIGSYRDNELTPLHPVWLSLEKIKAAGTAVHTITLAPLPLPHVTRFIADALHADLADVADLSDLVQAKTGGNPFFLGEFMKSLYSEGWLSFDYEQGRWAWRLEQIQAQEITDNVVTLMAAAIQKLAVKSQMALTLAACIGNRFELHTLAMIYGYTTPETAVALYPAILAGLIMPLNDTYRLAEFDAALSAGYKFAHDRIQQAAYTLIPEADRQSIHWQIGRYLLQAAPPERQGARIFDIVNHLNLGRHLLNHQVNREEVARLNLQAARAAAEAAAFANALEYGLAGIELISHAADPWQSYAPALELYTTAVEAAVNTGDYEQAEQLAQAALPHIHTLLDKIPIYRNLFLANTAQNQMVDAIALALPLLHELGIDLPPEPTRRHLLLALLQTRLALRGHSTEALLNLPLMADPHKLAAIDILIRVGGAAYFNSPRLFALIVLHLIQLCVKYGNYPEASRAYAAYGLILAGFLRDIDRGYEFGKLGLNLVQKLNARTFYPGTAQLFYHYLAPWKEHIRHSLEPLYTGYQIGMETGNLEFASNCSYSYACLSYYANLPLPQLIPDMEQRAAAMWQYNQHKLHYVLTMFLQTAVNLHGDSDTPWQLSGAHFDETVGAAKYREAEDRPALCAYLVQKGKLLYLFGHHREAERIFLEIETLLENVVSSYMVAVMFFYDALNSLALMASAGRQEQKQLRKRAAARQKKLTQWAQAAPMNFQHKAELVAAEQARLAGQWTQARLLYEQAIQHAHTHEFTEEEALAYELAGRFYELCGHGRLAHYTRQQAHHTYSRWGCFAKSRDLEARFPHLFTTDYGPRITGHGLRATDHGLPITTSTTGVSATAILDLNSVLKASQALSGEIKFSSLLNRLMALVIENAGAQDGYLLLPVAGEWQIAAHSGPGNGALETRLETAVPNALLNYVARAREHVVLDDAIHEGAFTQDPTLQRRQSRSVLCLPLLHHGNLTGILYLENNLAPGVFTPDRMAVLNLLASQAAISLENAQLVQQLEGHGRTLEQQVAQRTAALAEASQEAQSARTLAELANENKSLFLANMSRELRTPLNTIIGFTRLIKQQSGQTLPEKQVNNLDKVLVSADHLLGLINTVLDIAKIETGRMDMQVTEFDANALVESCLITTQPLLKAGVRLHKHFHIDLPPIHSDPAKIKQIVINLLSNAAKFTHAGHITVETTLLETRFLMITVADTGIGIAEEALPRVFEEFEQAESTTRQQYGGTGLGLPISRGLARLMGGDLTAVSEAGKGSVFTLTIPVLSRDP